MRDVVIREPRKLRPEPCTNAGITAYLQTMFAVAHTPGASHWCTPGHNRGKASEALALGTLSEAVAATSSPLRLRRNARLEGIDG
jgi:hypothetical protein